MRVAALFAVLCGCGFDIDHNIKFDVGLDSSCLTCLPYCTGVGYSCRDAEGEYCEGCEVGCVAGRALMCADDGPHCVQEFVGEDETVPVLCLDREGE